MYVQQRRYFILLFIVLLCVIFITFTFKNTGLNLRFRNYSDQEILVNITRTIISGERKGQTIRVCCLVLTTPDRFLTKAKAVNETWGKRCDGLYFITELTNNSSATYGLPIPFIPEIVPGYDHLTLKSRLGFMYAYKHDYSNYDWFLKADDDTYIIVENLKDFLYDQNSSDPITFGYHFKVIVKQGYHSGGASYVLSKESLRRFYEANMQPNSVCRKDGGSEDVEIANCLRSQGVYPGVALDKKVMNLQEQISGVTNDWIELSLAQPPNV
ncbi:unnamed protein product [Didymodactylos carnosus]|uniref:N-acetylgalactosaminide beta-1,3-galactosyltransferase n=1 Tax=Didymodactylos carnosus TaxID=1234261 RepID=A0A813VSN3_9BILA|nr:unnamed protein product [Didymodactylos carnosus]CAF1164143.1 unnamed protein product [Didymodactylos carnosus]CAF3628217.1 unnamed protein product [Didymodactylos carnosus]CAF3975797.1 unnamed protein product [Didymodactylos carnosus]